MTPEQFANNIDERLRLLRVNRPRETFIIAQELKTSVQYRIQTSGRDFTGAAFIGYSPKYESKRVSKGRQVAFVDFTDTGRLWANIRPEVTDNTKDRTIIEITARDRDNQAKLRGAVKQPKQKPRGNILIPSASEIELGRKANQLRVQKYLNL